MAHFSKLSLHWPNLKHDLDEKWQGRITKIWAVHLQACVWHLCTYWTYPDFTLPKLSNIQTNRLKWESYAPHHWYMLSVTQRYLPSVLQGHKSGNRYCGIYGKSTKIHAAWSHYGSKAWNRCFGATDIGILHVLCIHLKNFKGPTF